MNLTRASQYEIEHPEVLSRFARERWHAILYFWAAGPILDISKYLAAGTYDGLFASGGFGRSSLAVHGVSLLLAILLTRRVVRPMGLAQWIAVLFGLRGVALWVLGVRGFITVAFHGIVGAAAGATLVAVPIIAHIQYLTTQSPREPSTEALRVAAQGVFQFTTRAMFAFAALMGVALTILLQHDGNTPPGQFAYDQLTSGIQMLTGFTLTMFGAYRWIVDPVSYTLMRQWSKVTASSDKSTA